MTDFDAFMTKLQTLPPMSVSDTAQDIAFWREIDQMQQYNQTKQPGEENVGTR